MNKDEFENEKSNIFKEAQEVPTPEEEEYIGPGDFFDTIKILREEKRFTWPEIKKWFNDKGYDFSKQSIASAYHNRI